MTITAAQIRKLAPKASAKIVDGIVAHRALIAEHGIDTPQRLRHFMSQIAQESAGFTRLEESLNYTTTKRLREVWPTRFKTDAAAAPFVRNPRALANKVYASRMGNGNAATDDGWRYRGSGLKMTTGRANHEALERETGLPLVANPDMLRRFPEALLSAVLFWRRNNLNRFADADDLDGLTKAINGGLTGLKDRKLYLGRAASIWTDGGQGAATAPRVSPKPVPTPRPAPRAADDLDAELIKKVQGLLRDRGYPEVGEVDGDMGTRTRNAILAFQADNSLGLTGVVTDDLLSALVKAPQREIAPARANATAEDLKGAPSIDMAGTLKKVGMGGTIIGTGGALIKGLDIDGLIGGAAKFKSLADTVISISPWVLAAVAGIGAIWFGSRFIREQVEAYRQGRHV